MPKYNTNRLTRKQKESNDFEWIKERVDFIDTFNGGYRDYKKINNIDVNLNLLNGRLDTSMYENPAKCVINGEEITIDYNEISHTPLMAQIGNIILGEDVNSIFKPSVKDMTSDSRTVAKDEANEILKRYLSETIVAKEREQIVLEIMKQSGVNDIFELAPTPEAQLQLEQQINKRVEDKLPPRITNFINGKYKSPKVKQAQKMLNHGLQKEDVKYKATMAKKFAMCAGECYYYTGDRNGRPTFENVNPKYFEWGGGDRENDWSQHGDWAKREKWISFNELISRHSEELTKLDLDLLDIDFEPVGGVDNSQGHWHEDKAETKSFMYTFSNDEGLREAYSDVNIKTIEGRQKLFQAYEIAQAKYGESYGSHYSAYAIREAHIVFRTLRKMFRVKRTIDGVEKTFWLPEHYVTTDQDEEVKVVWINQIYECWKIGTTNPIYINIRPLPNQYKSLSNPHVTDLPYYGKRFNTHGGSVKNMAYFDLGKTYQRHYDITLSSIKQDMNTNNGKVFLFYMNLKPENMKWQDWFDLMRNTSILPIDPTRHGADRIDPNFLRSIDLSKVSDIASKIQMLEFFKQGLYQSMFFSEGRAGNIGQYANTTNVQLNQAATNNQTALFYEQHRMVTEKALGGYLNRMRHYYQLNPEEAKVFLDDVEIADLITSAPSWYEHLGIVVSNSTEELQKLEQIKANILPFIQNNGSPRTAMRLILADTKSEVDDIMIEEEEKMDKMRQEAQQIQQEGQQQALQANAQEKAADREHQLMIQANDLRSKEEREIISASQFQMANDVNLNKVSDLFESKLIELQTKMQMQDKELEFKRLELDLKEKLSKETV